MLLTFLAAAWIPLGAAVATPLDELVGVAAASQEAAVQRDILRGMDRALRGRRVPAPNGWAGIESRFIGSPDRELRRLTLSLGLAFGTGTALSELRRITLDDTAATDDRRESFALLLSAKPPGMPELLRRLVSVAGLRSTAIRGLAGYDDPETPGLLLREYARLGADERRDVLNTLGARATSATQLLAAVADGRVPRTDITADVVRQLRNLKDTAVTKSLAEIYGVLQETTPDMTAEIRRVRGVYGAGGSQPGDAPRGRAVFNRVCAQCHRLFDSGGEVGPDITGANRRDLDYLLQNILFPNAVIPNEYRASTVETKDGRVITGIVKSRDAARVLVQTANEVLSLRADEITRIELSEISMMPEGLLSGLKDQEMRDLIYYLTRTGQVPLPAGS
jgi:putative heme-binding domain-containing protein